MLGRKFLIGFCLIFLAASAAAQDGGFTSADVLAWSPEEQDGYFQTSVTMIGIVATQTGEHTHIAECIDNWYGGGDESQPQRSARIREVMQTLTDYHPQAVILAVVQNECGDF